MKPIVTSLVLAVLALALLVPAVHAQEVHEPLVARAEQKAAEAQADPVAFAGKQTSDEQLAEDANWTIAYACYVKFTAEEETGQQLPEVDRCAGFEEAIGIVEEEQEEAEEAVAEASELQDDVQTEAEAVAEDAVAVADEIVDDPDNAVEALLAFVDRTLAAAGRILDAVVGIVAGILVLPVAGPLWLGQQAGLLMLAAGPFTASLALDAADAVGAALGAAVEGVTDTAEAAAQATSDAVRGVTAAVADATRALGEAVAGLFDGGPRVPEKAPADPGAPIDEVTGQADGLLDRLVDLKV